MTCSVVRSLTLTDPTHRQSPKTRSAADAEGSSTAQGLQVYYQSADSSNFASPVHSQFSETSASHHNTKRNMMVAVILSECRCVQWPNRDDLIDYVRSLNRSMPSVRWWASCLDLAELFERDWAAF